MYTVIQKFSEKSVPPRWIFGEYCEKNGLAEHTQQMNGVTLAEEQFKILETFCGIHDRAVLNSAELKDAFDLLTTLLQQKTDELVQEGGNDALFDEVVSIQAFLADDMWNGIVR